MPAQESRGDALHRAITDLRRVAVLCADAGLSDEGARLLRVGNRLGPFAESPPLHREIDPFRR